MDITRLFDINGKQRIAILTVALIIIGSTTAGTGTMAYFSDRDRSVSNTIKAGTLDITLDGTNNDVVSSFSITDGKPGDSASHNFTLRNAGSVEADHVEIALSFSENDSMAEPGDTELNTELNASETAQQIEVTTFEYQDESGAIIDDILADVTDSNGNGITDLDDVANQAASADDLEPPQANGADTTHLVIAVRIADDDGAFTGTDEDIMADGVDVRIHFTLNQEASQ